MISIKMKRLFTILTVALCLLPVLGLNAQTVEKARELHDKGRQCLMEGNIFDGREYTRQAMEMRRELFGEINEDYITTLNNYALSYFMSEDYPEALRMQQKVLDLCRELDRPHPEMRMFLTNIGRTCYFSGYYKDAAGYLEEALPLEDKFSPSYEHLLSLLGLVYSEMNDNGGMTRLMALMEEHNKHELTKDCNEPECMLERAQYYAVKGDNAMARECFLKALAMDMEPTMKVAVNEAYAEYLFGLNDYVAAAEHETVAATVIKEMTGLSEDYAQAAFKAGIYSLIGKRYTWAVDLFSTVADFYSAVDSPAGRSNAARCYKEMGKAYNGMKDYESAKECYEKEIAYYESEKKDSDEYPKAILRLAKAEKFNAEYDLSIQHHKQAMALFEERGMIEDYSDASSSLRLCYVYAGKADSVDSKESETNAVISVKLNNIIKEEKANLELVRTFLGDLSYAGSLVTIAGSYELQEAYDSAMVYYGRYMDVLRDALGNEFRLQSAGERMITWQEQLFNIQRIQEMLVCLPEGNGEIMDELTALVYDAELLSKGILLKSSVEFGNLLESKEDEELKRVYEQSMANEKEIERLRLSAQTEDDLRRITVLSQQNQTLALRLYRECAEFADFTDYIAYDWKDVQKYLKDTDVAIEFVAVSTGVSDDDNLMVALVLTDDMEAPFAVPVCTLAEADLMMSDSGIDIFSNPVNLIWGSLSRYLEGRERIFFSPDGVFHQVAIEYLPYNGRPLSHQFDVFRLSSTKELCYVRPEVKIDKAVLIGDINYNDKGDYEAAAEHKDNTGADSTAKHRGSSEVDGFANLAATREEINAIKGMLDSTGVGDIIMYCDMEADKGTFLNISETDVNLLHIATHGTYAGTHESSVMASMSNSILALAGANISEDGIVSAEEISAMSLRQCFLVVLSACETGLGKLGDDGVFGLQRGFKNAGAHTILMSLNDVYDAATAQMMISFYRHLLEGNPAHDALSLAQQDLIRSGYSDPKYWTPFILLDAI